MTLGGSQGAALPAGTNNVGRSCLVNILPRPAVGEAAHFPGGSIQAASVGAGNFNVGREAGAGGVAGAIGGQVATADFTAAVAGSLGPRNVAGPLGFPALPYAAPPGFGLLPSDFVGTQQFQFQLSLAPPPVVMPSASTPIFGDAASMLAPEATPARVKETATAAKPPTGTKRALATPHSSAGSATKRTGGATATPNATVGPATSRRVYKGKGKASLKNTCVVEPPVVISDGEVSDDPVLLVTADTEAAAGSGLAAGASFGAAANGAGSSAVPNVQLRGMVASLKSHGKLLEQIIAMMVRQDKEVAMLRSDARGTRALTAQVIDQVFDVAERSDRMMQSNENVEHKLDELAGLVQTPGIFPAGPIAGDFGIGGAGDGGGAGLPPAINGVQVADWSAELKVSH